VGIMTLTLGIRRPATSGQEILPERRR